MSDHNDKMALAVQRIRQAEESIADAVFCFEGHRNGIAANRVYYGMYYAMLALSLIQGFKTSKHQQLIGWFNRNFVHTGVFPKHFTTIVKRAFDARMDADYEMDQTPSDADIEVLIEEMKVFIEALRDWIFLQRDENDEV